ncbi:diaminopropionate ammonia-lyase, partial [Mesorhizobium sp. M7A.F.Ca.CA.001.08.1.1]
DTTAFAGGDPVMVAGESGGVGLAGLIRAVADNRADLGLDGKSRVLVINTEGATDPHRYAELVGMSPTDVLEGKMTAEATA